MAKRLEGSASLLIPVRGFGNRNKDSRPFLHYWDLDKKGYRYATNWEIL